MSAALCFVGSGCAGLGVTVHDDRSLRNLGRLVP